MSQPAPLASPVRFWLWNWVVNVRPSLVVTLLHADAAAGAMRHSAMHAALAPIRRYIDLPPCRNGDRCTLSGAQRGAQVAWRTTTESRAIGVGSAALWRASPIPSPTSCPTA